MIQAITLSALLTFNPAVGKNCQPRQLLPLSAVKEVTATAYCLKGHTTSGPTTTQVHKKDGGCIALSRKLASDLGLKNGPGQYAYKFGETIEVQGFGHFTFADLMPPKWTGYRVDIYYPTLRQCKVFGVRKCEVRRVRRVAKERRAKK